MNAQQILSVGKSLTSSAGRSNFVTFHATRIIGRVIRKAITPKRLLLAAALFAGSMLLKHTKSSGSEKATAEKATSETLAGAKKRTMAHAKPGSAKKRAAKSKAAKPKKAAAPETAQGGDKA